MTINHFDPRTPEAVRDVLVRAQRSGERIRVFYGHTDGDKAGQSWHEENDVCGRVSNSTGPQKIPLLMAQRNSSGAPAMLDHCIVAIRSASGWLYKHPQFSTGTWTIGPAQSEGYREAAYVDGTLHAQFKRPGQATRYVAFMTGERLAR